MIRPGVTLEVTLKNKIFQFVWYYIVKPFIRIKPITESINPVIRNGRKIYVQLRLAELFGGFKRLIMGDSNSALFSRFMVMIKFKLLAASIGVPGSTFTDWLDFLKTDLGAKCLAIIKRNNPIICVNLGGNHVLLEKMALAEAGVREFQNTFPQAWYTTIVPIHFGLLGAIKPERGPEYYENGVIEVNGYIRNYCFPRVIDIYGELINPTTREAYPGILTDPAHLRRWVVEIIRRQFGGTL